MAREYYPNHRRIFNQESDPTPKQAHFQRTCQMIQQWTKRRCGANQTAIPLRHVTTEDADFRTYADVENKYGAKRISRKSLQDEGVDAPEEGTTVFKLGDGTYMRPRFVAEDAHPLLDEPLDHLDLQRMDQLVMDRQIQYPNPRKPNTHIRLFETLQKKTATALAHYTSDPRQCNMVIVASDPGCGKSVIPTLANLFIPETNSVVMQICNSHNNEIVHNEVKKCRLDQTTSVISMDNIKQASELVSYRNEKLLLQISINRRPKEETWKRWMKWIEKDGILDRIRLVHFDDSVTNAFMSGNSNAGYKPHVLEVIIPSIAKRGRSAVVITDQLFSAQAVSSGLKESNGDEEYDDGLARYAKLNRNVCKYMADLGVHIRSGVYPIHLDYKRISNEPQPHADIIPYIPKANEMTISSSHMNDSVTFRALFAAMILANGRRFLHCTADMSPVCNALVRCQTMRPTFVFLKPPPSSTRIKSTHILVLGTTKVDDIMDMKVPETTSRSNIHTVRDFRMWFGTLDPDEYEKWKVGVKYIDSKGVAHDWRYMLSHSMPSILETHKVLEGVILDNGTKELIRHHLQEVADSLEGLVTHSHKDGYILLWIPPHIAGAVCTELESPKHTKIFGKVNNLSQVKTADLAQAVDECCSKQNRGTLLVPAKARMIRSNNCFGRVFASVDLLGIVNPFMYKQMTHRVRRPNNVHDTVYCISFKDEHHKDRNEWLNTINKTLDTRRKVYKHDTKAMKSALDNYLRVVE